MHQKDYERFETLEDDQLRQDILSHIEKKEDGYYFMNRSDGRCFMLDEDGLCRIQRATSEKMLCSTCRKYPRIIGEMDGIVYLSMTLSCPVISKMLVEGQVQWEKKAEGKAVQKIEIRDYHVLKSLYNTVCEGEKMASRLQQSRENTEMLFYSFEKISEAIFEIIIRYKEGQYLLEDLSVFEDETPEEKILVQLEVFLQNTQREWERIYRNYIDYAVLTKTVERTGKKDWVLKQVYGELLLVRTLAFGRYYRQGTLSHADWQEILQRTYRFCVHGKFVSGEMTELFDTFFTKMYVWNYVLWSEERRG